MYNSATKDGNSVIDVLIDPNWDVPTIPANSPQEVVRDHAKFYGQFVAQRSVKSLNFTLL